MLEDYIVKYCDGKSYDFSKLLNDDFFQPVRILFNQKQFVSATKLLVIAIDSISYIEYGDITENAFIKWLNQYAEIENLGITSQELWEHRNALLHTSGLTSRKIAKGQVRTLIGYVGDVDSDRVRKMHDANTGYYNIYELIQVFAHGCHKWVKTYDADRTKFETFVERYDLIASDARMLHIQH